MKTEQEMNELMNANIEVLRDWALSLLRAARDSIQVSRLIAQANDDSKYAEWLGECDKYEALIGQAEEAAESIMDAREFMAVLGTEQDRCGHEAYESRLVGMLLRVRDSHMGGSAGCRPSVISPSTASGYPSSRSGSRGRKTPS